jgi:transposase
MLGKPTPPSICHGGRNDGRAATSRCLVGANQAAPAQSSATAQGRAPTTAGSGRADRNLARAQDRNSLGVAATGNGLRFGNDLLAPPARLASRGNLEQDPSYLARPLARRGQVGLVICRGGQFIGAGCFWGAKTGPNPTDRRKKGSKHHLITDANGIPLACLLTGANQHDVTQLIALTQAIPPIGGKPGRRINRPKCLYADRAYDSEMHRILLYWRGIEPRIAARRTDHGSGLGKYRWVVERTNSWLHQHRRLRVRYERRDDIHEAFMILGCVSICWKALNRGFC